jgi:hypothetical protein
MTVLKQMSKYVRFSGNTGQMGWGQTNAHLCTELDTGFFVHREGMRVESVSDGMLYIILRVDWCYILF